MANETHKVLFLNPDTLAVEHYEYISPPFVLGADSLQHLNGTFSGIQKPYIVLGITYAGDVTQDMLTDFQREIAYKVLEDNYKNKQINLMSDSVDYDEYTAKDTELKKKYFTVKNLLLTSLAPLLVDLSLS